MPLPALPAMGLSAAGARLLTKVGVVLALAALLFGWGYRMGSSHWRGEYKTAVTEHARVLSELAAKTKAAKDATQRAIAAYKANDKVRDAAHDKAVNDAYERGEAVGRAVGAGERRLRNDWAVHQCPAPGWDGALVVAPNPAELGRRAVAVGRVLGKAGQWDADYRRVYDALIDTRRLLAQCYGAQTDD